MTCGIYLFWFALEETYVGSSVKVEQRIKDHLKDCEKDRHVNQRVQSAYNTNGELFSWKLIIVCSRQDRFLYEQIGIDAYCPTLNMRKKATGVDHTPEVRQKIAAGWTPERRAARKAYMTGNTQCVGRKDSPETNAKKGPKVHYIRSAAVCKAASDRMKKMHELKDPRFKNYAPKKR